MRADYSTSPRRAHDNNEQNRMNKWPYRTGQTGTFRRRLHSLEHKFRVPRSRKQTRTAAPTRRSSSSGRLQGEPQKGPCIGR